MWKSQGIWWELGEQRPWVIPTARAQRSVESAEWICDILFVFRRQVRVVKAWCLECRTATSLMIHRPAAMTMTTMTMMAAMVIVPVAQPHEPLELWHLRVRHGLVQISAFTRVFADQLSLDCTVHTCTESKLTPVQVFFHLQTQLLAHYLRYTFYLIPDL